MGPRSLGRTSSPGHAVPSRRGRERHEGARFHQVWGGGVLLWRSVHLPFSDFYGARTLMLSDLKRYLARYVFDYAFDKVIDVAVVTHPSRLEISDLEVGYDLIFCFIELDVLIRTVARYIYSIRLLYCSRNMRLSALRPC